MKIVDPAKPADEYQKPAAGHRWVAIQFQLKNIGTAAYDDSPSNGAKVIDDKDQQFLAEIATDTAAGPSLPGNVKIAPGKPAVGFITFEVPTSSKVTATQFTLNSGFGPETGEWTLP